MRITGVLKDAYGTYRIKYQLNGEKINLVFAHSSTRSIDEYVLFDTDKTYVLGLLKESDPDLLFVGHSHKPLS